MWVQDPSLFLIPKDAREKEPSISPMFEPAKSGIQEYEMADLEKVWDKSPVLLPLLGMFRSVNWHSIEQELNGSRLAVV